MSGLPLTSAASLGLPYTAPTAVVQFVGLSGGPILVGPRLVDDSIAESSGELFVHWTASTLRVSAAPMIKEIGAQPGASTGRHRWRGAARLGLKR